MTCEDFAKSILCYLESDQAKKVFNYLADEDFDGSITMNEYVSFQHIMTDYYGAFAEMVKGTGFLTEQIIGDFIQNIGRGTISKKQINTFVKVLDYDKNGRIDEKEFVGILKARSYYGASENGA